MYLLSLSVLSACSFVWVSSVGPAHPPTKGAIWPQPQKQIQENGYYTFDPEQFTVEVVGNNCTILANSIRHYIYHFKQMKHLSDKYKEDKSVERVKREVHENTTENNGAVSDSPVSDRSVSEKTTEEDVHEETEESTTEMNEQNYGSITKLNVDLRAPCEDYPHLEMDESYNVTVGTNATLTSSSVWGIIRGLETFSQLFYFTDDFQEIRVDASDIADAPAYQHRGVLLDTARHYVPVRDILTTIEALAINKMNVFHWHLVDDQSFPYQSEKFPDLSARGAYHKSMVYTKSDIEMIIEYARERGVRVIPEFDVPGHTQSWGVAYPNLLTECYKDNQVTGLGPMNPVRNTTYKLIRDLFREVQQLFPDRYLHVGGDEVDLHCWQSNPEILTWMREHKLWSAKQLHAYFMERTLPLLQPRTGAVVWQEVFEEDVPLTNDTLIQVWQNWNDPGYTMFQALRAGYRVLFSSYWYLDHLGQTFASMLETDPRELVAQVPLRARRVDLRRLLGGEACMWAEVVDDTNLHSRVWPRASAVAERLWSGPPADVSARTLRRAEEHACRMRRRGVPAAPPSGPGYCLV